MKRMKYGSSTRATTEYAIQNNASTMIAGHKTGDRAGVRGLDFAEVAGVGSESVFAVVSKRISFVEKTWKKSQHLNRWLNVRILKVIRMRVFSL